MVVSRYQGSHSSVAINPGQCWCPLSRYQEMEICCTETHLYRLTQHTPAPPPLQQHSCWVLSSASKRSIRRFVITEKAPTRAFSWLKAATTAFTFKTLLRHYAKRALTPRSLNVKLGPRHNYHNGRAAIRHYANQPALLTFVSRIQFHVERPWDQHPLSIVS